MGIQTKQTSSASVILKSVATAAAVTLAASAVTALAIEKEWMAFEKTGYAAMGILLASGFLCGRAGKGRGLPAAAAAATGYLGILLLANLLFFGGQLQSMGITVLILTMGTALAVIQPKRKRKGRSRYKIPGV